MYLVVPLCGHFLCLLARATAAAASEFVFPLMFSHLLLGELEEQTKIRVAPPEMEACRISAGPFSHNYPNAY
jgi:hypothetical protein